MNPAPGRGSIVEGEFVFTADDFRSLDDLRRLPHPTLIVHGRDDRVIPLRNAYDLLALIPDAQLHVFGRCGHWTQIEHAARFAQLVANFLAEAG